MKAVMVVPQAASLARLAGTVPGFQQLGRQRLPEERRHCELAEGALVVAFAMACHQR